YDSALKFCSNARRVYAHSDSAIVSGLAATVCGFAELGAGRPDAALKPFANARQGHADCRDFWFVRSQIGTIESLLAQREMATACRTADLLLDQIGGFPEKTWMPLASRSCARAAAAKPDWGKVAQRLDEALKLVDESDLPLAAWRVYGTASEV